MFVYYMLPARCFSPVLLRITIACREGKVLTEKTTCSRLRAQASESGCPACPPAPCRRMRKGPGLRPVALQPQHLCLSEVGPRNWVSFLTNQVAEYIQYDPMRIKLKHAQSNCYGLNGVTLPSKFMLRSYSSTPRNVTSFGNRVTADVIS